MPSNIDSVEVISGQLGMKVRDFRRLAHELRNELPENSFFDKGPVEGIANDEIHVIEFVWSGMGSGRSEDLFVEKIAPYLIGKADIVLLWEDYGPTGWRIEDGKVTMCDVEFTLVPRATPPSV